MAVNLVSIIAQPFGVDVARRHANLDDNGDDLELEMLIAALADQAGQETGRSIALIEWELTLDGFPPGEILLSWPPIVEIVSVKYIDTSGVLQTLPDTQYVLDAKTLPGWLIAAQGTDWPATANSANAVTVTYRAGYGTACPESIRLWICAHLAAHYRNRESVGAKLEALPHVAGLLDRYRTWRL
jgi:uncharacterized phiE125 gp8 family phage protein